MDAGACYLLAADAILFLHAAFVAFIGGSLLLIFVGWLLNWSWVRNPWFRLAHLTGIGVVVLQSWLGIVCPVTTWEMALRAKAGDAVYAGSFVSHWLSVLLYYDAPQWVFAVCYTLFGLLVALSWYWVRPHPFKRSGGTR